MATCTLTMSAPLTASSAHELWPACTHLCMRRLSYIECTTQGIIPVEGLVLDDVPPGLHQLHCLPLKLIGADGAPVRCIIISS